MLALLTALLAPLLPALAEEAEDTFIEGGRDLTIRRGNPRPMRRETINRREILPARISLTGFIALGKEKFDDAGGKAQRAHYRANLRVHRFPV
jgi:hypothetical protein